MKDFLILATITIIGGALIPSTKALAILAVITNVVLWIAGKLGARGLQRVQEVPNSDCPPTQVSDRFAKCITLVIISAFFLGIAFMITVGVCQYFDFTPKNHREAICLFGLIVNMIVWPIAFFSKRQS
ncbi:MAG: hypothetical protein IIX11_06105 [Selenomonadales bacterium]|nr:hypothetical protein [Selenomonadales bacterium]